MTEDVKKTKKPAAKKADAKADAKAAPKKAAATTKDTAKKEAAPKKAAAPKKTAPKKGTALADASLYDVIVRPVITEKSTMAMEQNKVMFKVSPTATKPKIKEAVEALFGVTVTGVNTIKIQGKTKRFRGRIGKRSDVRKAVVTLKEGDAIDLAAGVK